MRIKSIIKMFAVLILSSVTLNASANSVGFDASRYVANTGQIVVRLTYDFTDFAMFGGWVNIAYDPNAIEFVSYTRSPLPPNAQSPASPLGQLTEPGLYSEVGVGTFELFTSGITTAGDIGTFVFNVLGPTDAGATFCGATLCIAPNPNYPFASLAGDIVTTEVIANGISRAYVVPLPAAMWLMLGGIGALWGMRNNMVPAL